MEERIVIWCNRKLKQKWELFKTILDLNNDELLEFLLSLADKKIQDATDSELESLIDKIQKIKN